MEILDAARAIVGEAGIVPAAALADRATSYWDPSPMRGRLLVRPASTEELSRFLAACHEAGQTVVVQGGLTGVVEGALATDEDVIVSLERMTAIESIDPVEGVAVIQAGAVLQTVQEALAAEGFLFPLDLGARGSCTIGGAVATNAGGINVLRYGMMRNLVLGLEAVLADGTVITSMQSMLKNNTGYDLKQLFIGSEGTLGIVTRVMVRLFPRPKSRQTVLAGLDSFDAVIDFLRTLKTDLAGTLSAYEVMWNNYFAGVTGEGGHRSPLDRGYPFYVIAEAEGAEPEADAGRFEAILMQSLEKGVLLDAVIPKSEGEREAIWTIREDFEALLPSYLYDVSLPLRHMDTYVKRLHMRLERDWPGSVGYVFGHIADGNLHIFTRPHADGEHHDRSDAIVYGCLEGLDGSVSAEHGIGLEKRAWLEQTKSPEELAMMRALKAAIDPRNLLNPGKILA